MKKKTDELLTDIFTEDRGLRETTLELCLGEMRRVRERRRAMRFAFALSFPILVLAGAIYVREFSTGKTLPRDVLPRVAQIGGTIPGTSIRVLNDAELLELFKGRPVALIGPAGHQRLILFDEAPNNL